MKYSVLSTMVQKVKFLLNRNWFSKIVLLLYETSPIICWCHWDNILEYLSFKTENIQLEEAQNVTGVMPWLDSKTLLQKETCRVPLSKRREDHRLILLFKIFHCKAPKSLLSIKLFADSATSTLEHNTKPHTEQSLHQKLP